MFGDLVGSGLAGLDCFAFGSVDSGVVGFDLVNLDLINFGLVGEVMA